MARGGFAIDQCLNAAGRSAGPCFTSARRTFRATTTRKRRMDARTDDIDPIETKPLARDARPLTHRETRLIVWGVLLPLFMGSLDNTILASALPTIGRDFGDMQNLSWLITAYLLSATACLPL